MNINNYYISIIYIFSAIILGSLFENFFNYIFEKNNIKDKNKSLSRLLIELIIQINIFITVHYFIKYCIFNISIINNYYPYVSNNEIFIIFTYIFLGFQFNLQNRVSLIVNKINNY